MLPLKRVRGNQKAVQEFASAFTESSRDTPSLRVGIAHADAPERAQALRALVADLRPQAQIDVDDDARRRSRDARRPGTDRLLLVRGSRTAERGS